jgi:hypothetical protein
MANQMKNAIKKDHLECVLKIDSKAVRKLLASTIADVMQLKSQNLPGAVKGSHMRTFKTTQLNFLGLVVLKRVDFDIISHVFLPFGGDSLWDVEIEDLQSEKDASTIFTRGIEEHP